MIMETTPLHPVVMKLNFPFITRKPSFNGRTLIEGRNTEMLHEYVLAFGLCACTKLDSMETTNTGDLSVYLAHSADYEQITVSTVPAERTE